MKLGEPFNPRFDACRFRPEELVTKRRELTDGQKLLYAFLVRWARMSDGNRPNERAGEVWRSHANIAAELGKSERQVRRDLRQFESFGLIKHRIRDGRKSNTYVFLFHPWFERESQSDQTPTESGQGRPPASAQTQSTGQGCPIATGHQSPVKPDLSGHPRPTNQKAFNQKEESSSSSSHVNGRLREWRDQAESEKTTKKLSLQPTLPTPSQPTWWTPEDLEKAAGVLTEFTQQSFLGTLDVATVLAIMPNMESIADLRLWLASSKGILKSAETWGRYIVDARHWPGRRAATWEQVRRAAASLPTCQHGVKPADQCGICAQERERARQAQQEAAERARAPRPPTPEEIAARAQHRRQEERVQKANQRWLAFWEQLSQSMRKKLTQMTIEAWKNGSSFEGNTIEEREAILDSLENRTHPLFQARVA